MKRDEMRTAALHLALAVFLLLLGSARTTAAAQERVVLDGFPDSYAYADRDTTGREVIPPAEREGSRVTIVERSGEFFWVTRENRQLIHAPSGLYHYFIDPRGGGYVKVLDQTDLPPESISRQPGPDVQFMEQVTLQLGTITYWGGASRWSPPGRTGPEERRRG
jgi:hypothetical protein